MPTLTEIKDEVVRAWKLEKARKPAMEHAKELAEQARKDNESLAKLAERDKLTLTKPEPFSWLTEGTMPAMNMNVPPRLSEVQGVQDAGPEFMHAVFTLPEGGITTVFNNPQTVVEVVQVLTYDPGNEVLRQGFLADNFSTYERATRPQREMQRITWNNSVVNEAGLKWVRPPDPSRDGA